ncbi:MAG: FAD-binding oxidoreductase [Legionella sp.]|uniref:FAD-binding oxidoreductase n=1 Tax=Legionella sp. TaxID=459 RepID=UPI0039E5A13E
MKTINNYFIILLILLIIPLMSKSETVNDITQLNPIIVNQIAIPQSIEEISQLIANHNGPISIGGGQYSQGGQIATENCLFLDMRKLNKIIKLDKQKKQITVEAGITWRKIQEAIDSQGLSLKIMQSFSNFTVGGSLSVNAHGRYVNEGAIIRSVESIKIVLADGTIIEANPTQNSDVFFGAIGGYGGLGVIVEATLNLDINTPVIRFADKMNINTYKDYFFQHIRYSKDAIFHNADLYPPDYQHVTAVTWSKTDKLVTIHERLAPQNRPTLYQEYLLNWIASSQSGKYFRQYIYDWYKNLGEVIEWRNYEASYDVNSIEPTSRKKSTYVLQEYFIPIENFDSFVNTMRSILKKNQVNVINISIRHALPDPDSYLGWARTEVFSFVIYYKQGVTEIDKQKVKMWTSQLIDAALDERGTYYLPYQILASNKQFLTAYPRAGEFFKLKNQIDPTYKFRNKFFDLYFEAFLKN